MCKGLLTKMAEMTLSVEEGVGTGAQSGMWKQKLEAEAVEAVLFLWKRKRENSTACASLSVI